MKTIKEIAFTIKENPFSIDRSIEDNPVYVSYFYEFDESKSNDILISNYILPSDLKEFWSLFKSAILFQDLKYGQWGLEILSKYESVLETKNQLKYNNQNYLPTDLIIGRFFGDSEVVVINCNDSNSSFGQILIGLPLFERSDWYIASDNLTGFLNSYYDYQGNKFWENI